MVAYRELRDIELQILKRLQELRGEGNHALDVTMGLRVSLEQFNGIEINWWPAKIAQTAMFLIDHQCNRKMALELGQAPDRLPIVISAGIAHENALTYDWHDLVDPPGASSIKLGRANPVTVHGRTFIFGNPPFLGQYTKSDQQTEEIKAAWGDDYHGYLDFVTAWHAKSLEFFRDGTPGEWAFVTTNSITQGIQVEPLFTPIFRDGWKIKFAHQTFAWTSEAKGAAAVHCVIVGFTKAQDFTPRLFEYSNLKGDPSETTVSSQINGYLIQGALVAVKASTTPISKLIKKAVKGYQATDNGNLIIKEEDYHSAYSDEICRRYIKRYLGSQELVNNLPRWCIWLAGEDPSVYLQSKFIRERVNACKEWRSRQVPSGDAYKFRNMPALMRPNKQYPSGRFVCVPSLVSHDRPYFTVAYLDSDTIYSNLAFGIMDPDGFQFSILSSSMFITWQFTVGGRYKSDPRFASKVTWNTFPMPEVEEKLRQEIIAGGQRVLEARAKFPERSLADQYNPLAMDPDLLKAHQVLDRAVDKAFGLRGTPTEAERLAALFAHYQALTRQ